MKDIPQIFGCTAEDQAKNRGFERSRKVTFLKARGLKFYNIAAFRLDNVHVNFQSSSLEKSHFSRPLKIAILALSGPSPGFRPDTEI